MQAVSKRHSTTEEALTAAASMGAYRTILTHFSQRYPKIPLGIPTSGAASGCPANAITACCRPSKSLALRYLTVMSTTCVWVRRSSSKERHGGV